ncbi:MAG TPA: zinc-binding dehydrogenase [Mycobacteriales bacterium]|nr:zinc-binding dehydrogenase [Mycobacteriales bacterium]
MAAGTLRAPVDRTFPLADAGAAITYLREGRVRGKVVLTV